MRLPARELSLSPTLVLWCHVISFRSICIGTTSNYAAKQLKFRFFILDHTDFLLPKHGNMLVSFVVSLDVPVRYGNILYPNILFLFDADEHVSLNLKIPEEDLMKNYDGKLKAV